MSVEVITTLSAMFGILAVLGGGFAWTVHRIDGVRNELRGDVSDLRDDINDLRNDVVEVKVNVARIEGRLDARTEPIAPAAPVG